MTTQYGNPASPCEGIARSKRFLETISSEAIVNAKKGTADAAKVETGLAELRTDTARILGGACTQICGAQNRCMLESFGPSDPLLRKRSLTPAEETELSAKRHFDALSLLTERALGIALL